MTVLCGGGASSPKPGVAQLVAYSGTTLAAFIEEILGPWAIPLAAAVGVLSWETPTFCASDPPTLPTWSAADWTELFLEIANPALSNGSASQKLTDTLLYYSWFNLCQCSSVATPAPTAFTQPTNPPTINSGGGSVGQVGCYSKSLGFNLTNPDFTFVTGGGDTRYVIDIGKQLFPNAAQHSHTNTYFGHALQSIDIGSPPPVSITGFLHDVVGSLTSTVSLGIQLFTFDSSDTLVRQLPSWVYSNGYSSPNPFTINFGSTERYIQLSAEESNTIPPRQFAFDVSLTCTGTQTFGSSCCPPDPVMQAYLDRILNAITQLQRYMLPFAYVNGAAHSGISGNGSFAISRLLGMAVSLTTIPNYVGSEIANPNRLFDVGWISIMDGDGNIQERRITQQTMTWIPRHFQEATTFGYFLNPGVVATFTELEAEP